MKGPFSRRRDVTIGASAMRVIFRSVVVAVLIGLVADAIGILTVHSPRSALESGKHSLGRSAASEQASRRVRQSSGERMRSFLATHLGLGTLFSKVNLFAAISP